MNGLSPKSASDSLTIVLNGEPQLVYDRNKPLPEQQVAYLGQMDRQMNAGIVLGGQRVDRPDQLQRAQFVSIHVIEALQQGNESLAAASSLTLRLVMPYPAFDRPIS